MKEHKKTTQHLQKMHSRCRVVFCIVSSLPYFCPFSGPSLTEMKLYCKLFSLVHVHFQGFLDHLPIRDERIYCAGDEHYWCGRRTYFAVVTNALVVEMNALKMCIRTSPTHTQLASSDFQTKLIFRRLLLTCIITFKNG